MNKIDLKKILQQNNVPSDLYSLDGGFPSESYCMNKTSDAWEVYYSERGKKRGTKYFLSEDEACEYFLEKVCAYAMKCKWERIKFLKKP